MTDRQEIERLYRKYSIEHRYGIPLPQFFLDLGRVGVPQEKRESVSNIEARVISLLETYKSKKPK